jgi:hypothetical protein
MEPAGSNLKNEVPSALKKSSGIVPEISELT